MSITQPVCLLTTIKPSFDWHSFCGPGAPPRKKGHHPSPGEISDRPGQAMHARLQLRAKCTYPSAISPGAMLLYPPSTQGLADADRGIEFVCLVDHGKAIGNAKRSKARLVI